MYTVQVSGGAMLFDPRVERLSAMSSPILTQEADKLASLEFTLYPGHPLYDALQIRGTVLRVLEDGNLLLPVRVVSRKRTFKGGIEYKCEDIFGHFGDIICRPAADGEGISGGSGGGHIAGHAIREEMQWLIGLFNTQTSNVFLDGFTLAAGTFSSEDQRSNWSKVNNEFKPYMDVMNDKLKDDPVYVIPRYDTSTGTLYIDALAEDDLPLGQQEIVFGKNLIDLFIDTNADSYYNRLIPLGKDTKTTRAQRNNGAEKNWPMTIATVNGGNDWIDLRDADTQAAEAAYGIVERTIRYEKESDKDALKSQGEFHYRRDRVIFQHSVTLTAIDLADAGVDVTRIHCMTRLRVTSAVHGISQTYMVRKVQRSLGAPTGTKIELGTERQTLTDITSNNAKRAASTMAALNSRVFGLENPDD